MVSIQDGRLRTMRNWVSEAFHRSQSNFNPDRFRSNLVDHVNIVRVGAGKKSLRIDPELENCVTAQFHEMPTTELTVVTKFIQDSLPRYYQVKVCTASSATLESLPGQFDSFAKESEPEMTHLACATFPTAGGLGTGALMVIGQRLEDFSPERIPQGHDAAFFSRCPLCEYPHICRVTGQKNSMSLECPNCKRTYAVIAADSQGRFRYVNEFLTGYEPPAKFPKDQSRIQELFTIWSAVHSNCAYVKDPSGGGRKQQTDSWQIAIETQQAQQGDCEDSSIFLADWLLARGFNARVVLGRYGDIGGHAWCVVKLQDKEYLLESTEGRPDPSNPPLVSIVGSRYIPEVEFDRYAIYVRSAPHQGTISDYWSTKLWTRIEPRKTRPEQDRLESMTPELASQPQTRSLSRNFVSPSRMARTLAPEPAGAPFTDLSSIPQDAGVWQLPVREGFPVVPELDPIGH